MEARVTVPSIDAAADLPAFIDLSGLGGRRTGPSLAGGFPLNVLGSFCVFFGMVRLQ
jgi:hypothetical protein